MSGVLQKRRETRLHRGHRKALQHGDVQGPHPPQRLVIVFLDNGLLGGLAGPSPAATAAAAAAAALKGYRLAADQAPLDVEVVHRVTLRALYAREGAPQGIAALSSELVHHSLQSHDGLVEGAAEDGAALQVPMSQGIPYVAQTLPSWGGLEAVVLLRLALLLHGGILRTVRGAWRDVRRARRLWLAMQRRLGSRAIGLCRDVHALHQRPDCKCQLDALGHLPHHRTFGLECLGLRAHTDVAASRILHLQNVQIHHPSSPASTPGTSSAETVGPTGAKSG
mmetsp:Transcript_141273/g.451275  ORF Transcript_141273/g.451275 Transcript_141273/m.451275 type:complete len:280 (+) Transcript_141273:586-1425(+)